MDKWLIEELYSSEDCRHKTLDGECGKNIIGPTEKGDDNYPWAKCGPCNKENCPLRVKKGE